MTGSGQPCPQARWPRKSPQGRQGLLPPALSVPGFRPSCSRGRAFCILPATSSWCPVRDSVRRASRGPQTPSFMQRGFLGALEGAQWEEDTSRRRRTPVLTKPGRRLQQHGIISRNLILVVGPHPPPPPSSPAPVPGFLSAGGAAPPPLRAHRTSPGSGARPGLLLGQQLGGKPVPPHLSPKAQRTFPNSRLCLF